MGSGERAGLAAENNFFPWVTVFLLPLRNAR